MISDVSFGTLEQKDVLKRRALHEEDRHMWNVQ